MNEHFASPPQRPTTRAAEGLPRWRWTVAEVERLEAAGIFAEYDKFELLGGEIVPTGSPAERRHETIRIELAHHMAQLARKDFLVAQRPQFNLAPDTFVTPDILVHPRFHTDADEIPPTARLVPSLAPQLAVSQRTRPRLSGADV